MFIVDVAVVWLVWVSWVVSVVLFKLVAVGLQEWVSLMVQGALAEAGISVVVVE